MIVKFGTYVIQTNHDDGKGWQIEADPNTKATLMTRDHARQIKRDHYDTLTNIRVRVVPSGVKDIR